MCCRTTNSFLRKYLSRPLTMKEHFRIKILCYTRDLDKLSCFLLFFCSFLRRLFSILNLFTRHYRTFLWPETEISNPRGFVLFGGLYCSVVAKWASGLSNGLTVIESRSLFSNRVMCVLIERKTPNLHEPPAGYGGESSVRTFPHSYLSCCIKHLTCDKPASHQAVEIIRQ